MVEPKTTEGSTERGNANQRHFVRTIDNDLDGAGIVISHGLGEVSLYVEDDTVLHDILRAADDYGGDVSFAQGGASGTDGIYTTGDTSLDVRFD